MTSSSSSSPEIQPASTASAQERFTYKHATHDEVLEDLSRSDFSAFFPPRLAYFSVAGFSSIFPTKSCHRWSGYAFRWSKRKPLGYHDQTCASLYESIAIGSTKTSFERKIPSFRRCLSRSSPRCYSTPALYCINGVTITNKLSTPSCSTRQEFLFVVQ